MLIWILIIALTIVLDQASKLLVEAFLSREEPFILIEGVFRFTYVENRGAAFGMLDEHRWIFMVLSTIGILAVFIFLWKYRPKRKLTCIALCFVIGGGIGNMIDRVRLGYVIDFLDFYAFPDIWMWVFNVADAFVCVGAGMLILGILLDFVKESKESKALKATNGNKEKDFGIDAADKGSLIAEAKKEKEDTNTENTENTENKENVQAEEKSASENVESGEKKDD